MYTCKLTRPETGVLKYSLPSKKEGKPSKEKKKKQSPKYFENETPLGFSVNLIKFLFIAEKLSTFKS